HLRLAGELRVGATRKLVGRHLEQRTGLADVAELQLDLLRAHRQRAPGHSCGADGQRRLQQPAALARASRRIGARTALVVTRESRVLVFRGHRGLLLDGAPCAPVLETKGLLSGRRRLPSAIALPPVRRRRYAARPPARATS